MSPAISPILLPLEISIDWPSTSLLRQGSSDMKPESENDSRNRCVPSRSRLQLDVRPPGPLVYTLDLQRIQCNGKCRLTINFSPISWYSWSSSSTPDLSTPSPHERLSWIFKKLFTKKFYKFFLSSTNSTYRPVDRLCNTIRMVHHLLQIHLPGDNLIDAIYSWKPSLWGSRHSTTCFWRH